MSNKECFILMPISTPPEMVDIYSGDKDHFNHILEHLFIPAIEKGGFKPIPPIVKGSEIIHAEIIQNIEKADCLLCDMSTLNANVFFELGIRTAVNKRVALVKDDATPKVPFDTHLINNHTYLSSLSPWTLKAEIKKLTDHLVECFSKEEKSNTLWKYFSLSAKTEPLGEPSGEGQKIDYLTMQIEALRKEVRDTRRPKRYTEIRKDETIEEKLFHKILKLVKKEGIEINKASMGDGMLEIYPNVVLPEKLAIHIKNMAIVRRIDLIITVEE